MFQKVQIFKKSSNFQKRLKFQQQLKISYEVQICQKNILEKCFIPFTWEKNRVPFAKITDFWFVSKISKNINIPVRFYYKKYLFYEITKQYKNNTKQWI